MIGLHERIMIVIVNVADLDPAKVMAHVRVCHPEKTLIVSILRLFFDVIGPEITCVSPGTAPFEITPRVSEVDDSDLFSESVSDFAGSQKTI